MFHPGFATAERLPELLTLYQKFLPVDVNGETYHLFNCLEEAEVIESSIKRDYEGKTRLGVSAFEFAGTAAEKLVFKTQVESCLTLYCNQRFKAVVEDLELKGITFDDQLLLKSPFEGNS